MLVLQANQEQIDVFHKLIQAMGGQVVWNEYIAVENDSLLLEGAVRSLCFQFHNKKVETKILDFSADEEDVLDICKYPGVCNLIAMAVYAFGAWGTLKGVHISQDMEELNRLFREILAAYEIEPDFGEGNFRFYQSGNRITYEKVIMAAAAYEKVYGADTKKSQAPVLALPKIVQNACNEDEVNSASGNAGAKVPVVRDREAVAKLIDKFHARIGVLDRLSGRQIFQLKRDIRIDKLLTEKEKEELLYPIEDFEFQERMRLLEEQFADKKNKTYKNVKRVAKDIEKEELPDKVRDAVLAKLQDMCMECGLQEVREIMEQTPAYVEGEAYEELMKQLAPYEEVHMSPYQERLSKMRERVELKAISNIFAQAKKSSRADYIDMLRQIQERNFAAKTAAPYIEQILDHVRDFDKARLDLLVCNVQAMDFDKAADLYTMIQTESFLPELRADAMNVLAKRLTKIRMDTCGLLVGKMREVIASAVKPNPRHHLYPAQKDAAQAAELKVFQNALTAYAEERGDFEFPILLVDTSKNGNGGEGMLLTPENLFYSTRLSGYRIAVPAIKSIQVSSGLLNRRLLLEETNGVRHKLPHAVEAEELPNWAKVLDVFVKYLQKIPTSDKLTYQANETTDAVSCKRCGCVYQGGNVCPECGYPGKPEL